MSEVDSFVKSSIDVQTETSNLTILRAHVDVGKTYELTKSGWLKKAGNGRAKHFDAKSVPVHDLVSLHDTLRRFSRDPHCAVITEDLKKGVNPNGVLRRSINFDRVYKPFILFDLDALGFAESDLNVAGRRARDLLPLEFRNAACSVQATSSHMLPLVGPDEQPSAPQARLRLVFWLDRPINHAQARQWSKQAKTKIDESLFDAVHLTYIAAPAFVGGADPVPERWTLLDGNPVAHVPETLDAVAPEQQTRDFTAPADVPVNSDRAINDWLSLVEREFEAKRDRGRNNFIRNRTNDALDRAIEPHLIESLWFAIIAGSDDDGATLFDDAENELREAGCRDVPSHMAKIRRIAANTAESWQEGDPLDFGDVITRQMADAEKYRQTEFGSWFSRADTGQDFDSVAIDDESEQPNDQSFALDVNAALRRLRETIRLGDPATLDAQRVADAARAKGYADLAVAADGVASSALFDEPIDDAMAAVEAAVAAIKTEKIEPKAFTLNFVSLSDCIEDAKILDNAYVVKGMIGQGEVVGLAAKFNTGKTFFALHLAACVATGRRFFGRRVTQGAVIYVSGEGNRSIRRRVAAAAHNVAMSADAPFYVLPQVLNLLDAKQGAAFLADMEAKRPALVVIDTVNVAIGGVEENNENLGKFALYARDLANRTGAAVLLLHHFGKDEKAGMRGGTVLPANIDNVFAMARQRDGTLRVHTDDENTKMKDGPKGWGFDFRLKVVKLGIDADGDAVTTCVIEELDESESLDAVSDEAGKPARLPPVESLVMHAMRTKGDGEWTAAQLAEALGEDTTRASVKSALARLREKGFLAWREGGFYRLADRDFARPGPEGLE